MILKLHQKPVCVRVGRDSCRPTKFFGRPRKTFWKALYAYYRKPSTTTRCDLFLFMLPGRVATDVMTRDVKSQATRRLFDSAAEIVEEARSSSQLSQKPAYLH